MDRQLCYNKFYYKPSYGKLDNFLLDYALMIGIVLRVIYEVQELANGKKDFHYKIFYWKRPNV